VIRNRPSRFVILAAIALAVLATATPAFSQSCALCYTQAASSGVRMIQALKSGILILIIPPMGMTAGFFAVAYRRSHRFKRPDESVSVEHGGTH
jgi:hypothetical protein